MAGFLVNKHLTKKNYNLIGITETRLDEIHCRNITMKKTGCAK